MPCSHHYRHHIDGRSLDGNASGNVENEDELYVPKRSAKKSKYANELGNTQEVMKLIQEAVKNDPTRDEQRF